MNNEGKKSRIYGGEKGGIYGGFCSLCGSRVPLYGADYPGEKICVMCHATLIPWDGEKSGGKEDGQNWSESDNAGGS